MALPPGRRLFGAGLTLILVAIGPCSGGPDGAHPTQGERLASLDTRTTGSLPPSPPVAPAPPVTPAPEIPAPVAPVPAVPLAPPPPPPLAETIDLEPLKTAVAAYRKGRLAEGDAVAETIDDKAVRGMLEWVALRTQASAVSFERIAAFLDAFPDYPGTLPFRRRAEAALIADRRSAEVVRAYFHGREPISPAGRIALARALLAEGREGEAFALARRSWLGDHLGAGLEKIVLAAFGEKLTAGDHRLRAERYLFAGNGEAALRNATRVSPDYVALAKVRLASAKAKGPIPQKQIDAVPAAMKKDISFAFLQAQQARRSGKTAEAVKALAEVPRDPALLGDGDGWWTERRLIARKLLDEGDAKGAYAVVANHAAEEPAERIDAEWHAGWIALRFEQDAERAAKHFAEAAKLAETPISVARACYWQGRAAEALGKADEAKDFYGRAGEHPVAYYGQLARAKLGLTELPVRRTVAASLAHLPGFRAARLLYAIDAPDLAGQLLLDLAQRMQDTAALEAIADVARQRQDVKTLLAIGKTSLQRGFPLDEAAFPTFGVPDFPVVGDEMERAIVHAIARQESAFDPGAVSHAGALGLMQMMPATARETAKRANLPFEIDRLTRDPLYSAQMGAAHLNDLLDDWRGSYVLTFASYNAGPGNVRKWIAAYGDPRSPDVDAVDWIERIPFTETRNYVQRVMENLQVYRQRLNQRTAYLIDHDLKRGGRRE
jgi:soluble lytic murein transglycosylase